MSSSHRSLWADTAERPARPALEGTVAADVAIVGAGITGLTTALELQEAGFSVVVVEAGRVGSGTTGHTSAHLSSLWDGGYHELIHRHGSEAARRVAAALQGAIVRIEELVAKHALECAFGRVPGYFYAEAGQPSDAVERELRAAQRIGLDVEATREVPLAASVTQGLRIADQARFHPLRYLLGLAEAVEEGGGRIFERTRVVDVAEEERCRVTSAMGARVLAREVVMATHLPLGISPLQTEAAPYRSYVIAFPASGGEADALLWDSAEPYHYTRELRDGARRWRIVGGADHKTGEGDERACFVRLERYARERHAVEKVEYRWSSQLYEPVDRLPFIGRAPLARHTFVATGFSGDGLTFGTHAAAMLADLVGGRGHGDEGLYRPTRIAATGLCRFLRENAGVARHFVGDRLALRPERDLETLSPGEGCVVRAGLSPVAAWRSSEGALHRFSAVCPHLKCLVRWNAAERSFDCPCHGSRFDTEGQVIEGPALHGLERL